ncbi:SDR family NAD(P)-dependent oxidoreductase [Fusibacter paucivorans]|uniref:SDR family NAD(P)-dependent oxidoreductase n=2 Tax=Fusibacter paucivorans TaxID=76009 RepID=A0ABS5PRZ9_9FIRM|nr:SDR family NAD(P)-dependent oxidoreductase [Fusibacter paucivorans]
MNSMKGKLVVVTGPTSGIGKKIASDIGNMDANLVLACRDINKGRQVAEEIIQRNNTAIIDVMHIDMSDIQSIKEFACQFRKKYSRLDVLVNNAGVNLTGKERQNSVQGIELTFATNVLGYYLLTCELLELLKSNGSARIVNVASTFANDVNLDDVQFEHRPYDAMKAYAQSKACDRMLTWAFARRLENSGVTSNAMAPGLTPDTGLFRSMPVKRRLELSKGGGRSIEDGADTAVWLASSSETDGISGKFFEKRQEIACEFRDVEAEEKLWSICEELTGYKKYAASNRKCQ